MQTLVQIFINNPSAMKKGEIKRKRIQFTINFLECLSSFFIAVNENGLVRDQTAPIL